MDSKKQFDHIEEKIKQAAENNLPPFDEKGWQLMEAKLDKENKKRRPFLWWFVLPLLLAGGWGGYQLLKPSDNSIAKKEVVKKETDKEQGNAIANLNSEKVATVDDNKQQNIVEVTNNLKKASTTIVIESKKKNRLNISSEKGYSGKVDDGDKQLFLPEKIKGMNKGKMSSKVSGNEPSDDVIADIEDKTNSKKDFVTAIGDKKNEPVSDASNDKPVNDNKPSEQKKADDKNTIGAKEEAKPEKKKEEKNKKSNKGFYVLASGGADAGNTRLFSFSNSSITPKYGVGVGYQFSKRLSVQTGFYVANKKYVTNPEDYNIKPGSPMAAYQIDRIKATCLVYEIPLTVKYDIISKPSVIFYAAAGMSSYILKKEKYDCFYHYYGAAYEQEWQYSGNSHFFSIADFSIGIEKKISSHFSLIAEPSVSIPVSGVGDGKVKLYSTALQLGLKYYLFKKQ